MGNKTDQAKPSPPCKTYICFRWILYANQALNLGSKYYEAFFPWLVYNKLYAVLKIIIKLLFIKKKVELVRVIFVFNSSGKKILSTLDCLIPCCKANTRQFKHQPGPWSIVSGTVGIYLQDKYLPPVGLVRSFGAFIALFSFDENVALPIISLNFNGLSLTFN